MRLKTVDIVAKQEAPKLLSHQLDRMLTRFGVVGYGVMLTACVLMLVS